MLLTSKGGRHLVFRRKNILVFICIQCILQYIIIRFRHIITALIDFSPDFTVVGLVINDLSMETRVEVLLPTCV